jgi:CRISPR-associated endonuclease Csn1
MHAGEDPVHYITSIFIQIPKIKPMKRILGLDLGTNSIGWAVVDADNQKIIDTGSRIFPMGVVNINEGEDREKSKNATRREFRQARRQTARRRLRKIKLLELLIDYDMCPLTVEELNKWRKWDKQKKTDGRQFPDTPCLRQWLSMNPYELRKRGVEGELSRHELGRVLYHMIQRRGFASSRKEKDTGAIFEGKENMAGIHETQEAMDGQTLGQFLHDIVPDENTPYTRKKNEKGEDLRARGRYTLRDMYVEEFERIWQKQAPNLQLDTLTTERKKRIFLKGGKDRNRNSKKINYLRTHRDKVEVKEITLQLEDRETTYTQVDTLSRISLHDMLGGNIRWEEDTLRYDNKDSVLFFQRPLRSQKGLLGKCRYETTKTLANTSHPLVEEFTAWQFVNTIQFGNKQSLSIDQKAELVDFLLSKKTAQKFEKLIKHINLLHETFNYPNDHTVPVFPTHAQLMPLFSAAGWQNQAHEIWHDFFFYDDSQRLFEKLQRTKAYGLKKDINIEKIEAVSLKDQTYASLSLKAIGNILPFLKRGLLYSHAVLLGGVKNAFNYGADNADRWERFDGSHEQIIRDIREINKDKSNKEGDAIRKIKRYLADPANEYAFAPDDKAFSKLYHPSQEVEEKETKNKISTIENLRNPVVQRSVQEMRRLVNELMATYGTFDRIAVEMGREMKMGKKRRGDKQFEIKTNNKKNEEARATLRQYGLRPSRENLQKVLMFREIEERSGTVNCPYTGKSVGIGDLLGSYNTLQVEHIIPRSVSLDDSFANKTLCDSKFNQLKGNLTPYQFYEQNGDPKLWGASSWEQVAHRAFQLLPYNKAKRFTTKNKLEQNGDFISRQLNDDRYISKKTKEILSEVCDDVLVMAGGVTAELRRLWGLNNVLQPVMGVGHYNMEADAYKDLPHWAVLDENRQVKEVLPQQNPRPKTEAPALCLTGEITNQRFFQREISVELPAPDTADGTYFAVLPKVQVKAFHQYVVAKPQSAEQQLVLRGVVKKGKFMHDSLPQRVDVDKSLTDGNYYATFTVTQKTPKYPDEQKKVKHKNGLALFGAVENEVFTSYIYQCQTNMEDGKYWMLLDLDFDSVRLVPTRNPKPSVQPDEFVLIGDVNDDGDFLPKIDAQFRLKTHQPAGRYWAVVGIGNEPPVYTPEYRPQPEIDKNEKLVEGRVWVNTETGEITFDPRKNRDDHRHHAIDAMVIALTNQRMVQELNRYNAQRDEAYRSNAQRPTIEMPWEGLREDVQNAAENILISHHKNNPVLKRVSMQVIKEGKKLREQGVALRGQLHKETVFGKRSAPDTDEHSYHVRKPIAALKDNQLKKIVDKRIREIVMRAREEEKPLQKEIKDLQKKRTKEGTEGEQVIDTQIADLHNQIDALYTLPNKNGEPVPIKKVRIREKLGNTEMLKSSREINQYVNPRNNHHVLIYRDAEGNLKEEIVTLWEAAERQKQGLPVYLLPEDGTEIVTTLEVNDMFLIGCPYSRHELARLSPRELSPYFYRVQKLSSMYYTFRHHLAASIRDEETELRIVSFKAWEKYSPIKIQLKLTGHLNGQEQKGGEA